MQTRASQVILGGFVKERHRDQGCSHEYVGLEAQARAVRSFSNSSLHHPTAETPHFSSPYSPARQVLPRRRTQPREGCGQRGPVQLPAPTDSGAGNPRVPENATKTGGIDVR